MIKFKTQHIPDPSTKVALQITHYEKSVQKMHYVGSLYVATGYHSDSQLSKHNKQLCTKN